MPSVATRTTTLRQPAWSYLHLELYSATSFASTSARPPSTTARTGGMTSTPPASSRPGIIDLDAVTARLLLTRALSRHLGLAGSSIPMDILKLDGAQLWIRVPRQDLSCVMVALGAWEGPWEVTGGGGAAEKFDGNGGGGANEIAPGVTVAWRIRDKGNWLMGLLSSQMEQEVWNR
ncbi:MAG: hypothetical protein M1838_005067 [Thelocarpon superellum]|nr:MAG: hypothetical protein M1838_005067 [Thelocarpon superellum]